MLKFNKGFKNINSNSYKYLIYKSESEINYKIYISKNIDTFLIAAGIYTNFDNPYIFPSVNQRALYGIAKKHFELYKNHSFIKKFDKYMSGKDINSRYMSILLNYSDLPELEMSSNTTQFDISIKEVDEFLELLKAFYIDTNAEEFFANNAKQYDALSTYVKQNIEKSNVLTLIKEVELYTGNKQKYYGGFNISYNTILSFYRCIGSFTTQKMDNEKILTSMQFAYKPKSTEFDIDSIIITSVHEYLHNYINQPVANNNDLIERLTSAKNKKDYISQFYIDKNFPWNRITDENFVRAIEARIYKKLFGEEKALKSIVEPETKKGFKQVMAIYDKLAEYEENRETYPTIDDFMPEIIKEMYNCMRWKDVK